MAKIKNASVFDLQKEFIFIIWWLIGFQTVYDLIGSLSNSVVTGKSLGSSGLEFIEIIFLILSKNRISRDSIVSLIANFQVIV